MFVALVHCLALAAAPSSEAEAQDIPPLKSAAFVTSAVLVSGAAGLISVYAGTRPGDAVAQSTGRPSPFVSAAGFGLALALNFALTHLLIPQLVMFGDTELRAGDVTAAREEAWRRSRWALLGSGLGLVTTFVGAGLEQAEFGRGQGVMLAGLLVMFVGVIVADVLEATGAWRGYLDTRSAR